MRNERGAMLVEVYLLIFFVFGILFKLHVELIRNSNEALRDLQTKRLGYDGVAQWKR